jgi:hypothetical protein
MPQVSFDSVSKLTWACNDEWLDETPTPFSTPPMDTRNLILTRKL